MRTFEGQIREVVRETADTVTLILEAPDAGPYSAGQFLNIDPHQLSATRERAIALEQTKGRKERPRAYSLASAPHEPHLALTIKSEPDGQFPSLMSPYLVGQAKAGDRLPCTGFAGLYTLPSELPDEAHVVHVCAGGGIVPNYGLMKDALHRGLPQRHTLLFSNRRWDEIIYRRELGELARKHPEQLRIVHALTREPAAHRSDGTIVCDGRIGEARLREHVPELDRAWFFVCGPSVPNHERAAARARGESAPPRFLECMKALLHELGVEKRRIHYEGW